MPIRSSVGSNGVNRSDDTRTVQELLNKQKGTAYKRGPIAVDGQVGPETIGAITEYQKVVIGYQYPDGRVDPGYQTIAALEKNALKPTANETSPKQKEIDFSVIFRHGGLPPANNNSYESRIAVSGPAQGTFQGSIYPDNLNTSGRIKDGTYQLQLGFHKRGGQTPTEKDLCVKYGTQMLRPALIVNHDNPVPVVSNNANKKAADSIHIHNAQPLIRGSEGCLVVAVVDWAGFIGLFLEEYPNFEDWFSITHPGGWWDRTYWLGQNCYVGKRIGTLVVTA